MDRETLTLFDVERIGAVLVITPAADLGSLDFEEIRTNGGRVLEALDVSECNAAVIDLHRVHFLGSSALAFFGRIWSRISKRNGTLALCNLSPEAQDLLRITKLNAVWKTCSCRDEAIVSAAATTVGAG